MTDSIFAEGLRLEPWWWQAAGPRPAGGSLPAAVDVAVLGAGFTGLSAALVLARAGRSVLVLDAGEPGGGASTRNGGMIGSGHRVGLATLVRRFGRQAAVALLGEGVAALDFTADLIAREEIACHFARCGRFRAAWRPEDYEAMGREIEELKAAVGLEAHMVPRAEQHREVASDAYHGGCVYPRHGGLHPGLFHRGLLDRVAAAGGAVMGLTAVDGIARATGGFDLATSRGRLRAQEVIVATNGYTGAATPGFRRRLVPVASFLIATEVLGRDRVAALIPGGRMIVESRERHCYYRAAPDGERLLFGGRAGLRPRNLLASAQVLHGLMTGLFPDLAAVKITHSWSGFVAMSRGQLPHLGQVDGLHYALGYNGSGVAMAPYLGAKIGHKLLGRPEARSPFEDTPFKPLPLYRGRPWFLPLLELKSRLIDRRQGSG
jgi:glycine/D-amino acid oxidase-like deaminating enzyme